MSSSSESTMLSTPLFERTSVGSRDADDILVSKRSRRASNKLGDRLVKSSQSEEFYAEFSMPSSKEGIPGHMSGEIDTTARVIEVPEGVDIEEWIKSERKLQMEMKRKNMNAEERVKHIAPNEHISAEQIEARAYAKREFEVIRDRMQGLLFELDEDIESEVDVKAVYAAEAQRETVLRRELQSLLATHTENCHTRHVLKANLDAWFVRIANEDPERIVKLVKGDSDEEEDALEDLQDILNSDKLREKRVGLQELMRRWDQQIKTVLAEKNDQIGRLSSISEQSLAKTDTDKSELSKLSKKNATNEQKLHRMARLLTRKNEELTEFRREHMNQVSMLRDRIALLEQTIRQGATSALLRHQKIDRTSSGGTSEANNFTRMQKQLLSDPKSGESTNVPSTLMTGSSSKRDRGLEDGVVDQEALSALSDDVTDKKKEKANKKDEQQKAQLKIELENAKKEMEKNRANLNTLKMAHFQELKAAQAETSKLRELLAENQIMYDHNIIMADAAVAAAAASTSDVAPRLEVSGSFSDNAVSDDTLAEASGSGEKSRDPITTGGPEETLHSFSNQLKASDNVTTSSSHDILNDVISKLASAAESSRDVTMSILSTTLSENVTGSETLNEVTPAALREIMEAYSTKMKADSSRIVADALRDLKNKQSSSLQLPGKKKNSKSGQKSPEISSDGDAGDSSSDVSSKSYAKGRDLNTKGKHDKSSRKGNRSTNRRYSVSQASNNLKSVEKAALHYEPVTMERSTSVQLKPAHKDPESLDTECSNSVVSEQRTSETPVTIQVKDENVQLDYKDFFGVLLRINDYVSSIRKSIRHLLDLNILPMGDDSNERFIAISKALEALEKLASSIDRSLQTEESNNFLFEDCVHLSNVLDRLPEYKSKVLLIEEGVKNDHVNGSNVTLIQTPEDSQLCLVCQEEMSCNAIAPPRTFVSVKSAYAAPSPSNISTLTAPHAPSSLGHTYKDDAIGSDSCTEDRRPSTSNIPPNQFEARRGSMKDHEELHVATISMIDFVDEKVEIATSYSQKRPRSPREKPKSSQIGSSTTSRSVSFHDETIKDTSKHKMVYFDSTESSLQQNSADAVLSQVEHIDPIIVKTPKKPVVVDIATQTTNKDVNSITAPLATETSMSHDLPVPFETKKQALRVEMSPALSEHERQHQALLAEYKQILSKSIDLTREASTQKLSSDYSDEKLLNTPAVVLLSGRLESILDRMEDLRNRISIDVDSSVLCVPHDDVDDINESSKTPMTERSKIAYLGYEEVMAKRKERRIKSASSLGRKPPIDAGLSHAAQSFLVRNNARKALVSERWEDKKNTLVQERKKRDELAVNPPVNHANSTPLRVISRAMVSSKSQNSSNFEIRPKSAPFTHSRAASGNVNSRSTGLIRPRTSSGVRSRHDANNSGDEDKERRVDERALICSSSDSGSLPSLNITQFSGTK